MAARLHSTFQFLRQSLGTLGQTLPILWQAAPAEATLITLALLVQGLLPALMLFLAKAIVDTITAALAAQSELTLALVAVPVLIWIGTIVLSALLGPLTIVAQGNLGDKLTAHINLLLMEKSASLPGLNYFENVDFYNEIEVVKREARYRPMNLLFNLVGITRDVLTLGGMLILLLTLAWWIPLVLLLAAIPRTYVVARMEWDIWDVVMSKSKDVRQMTYFSSVMMTDTFAKEVRQFGLGPFFIERYRTAFRRFFLAMRRVRNRQTLWSMLLVLLSVAVTAFVFYDLIQRTLAGLVTLGSILVFIQALASIQQSLPVIGQQLGALYESLLYMRQFFKFLNLPPDLPLPDAPHAPPATLRTGIRFEGVGFAYPDGRQALTEVSLTIRAGETVAIVGENGAGKTTLVKLLARFYDPSAGRIWIDDRALDQVDLTRWRQQIAVVFQDFNHFALTVGENIHLGRLDQTDGVQQAAERAGIRTLIEGLPDAYDTQLGKQFDGTELSGGQWQKIALARAFARHEQAQLLVLDEPTASLDPRSEYEIYRQFVELAQDKTTLLITHRLASVRMADRIIVLKDGRLVEAGTHAALLAQGGEYAALWTLQAQQYQEADTPANE